MARTSTPPLGFGRRAPDPDPNGTGDGFQWQPENSSPEQAPEIPERQPLGQALAINDAEAGQILEAYGLFPLAPLSKFEYQLLEIIAGLEQQFGPTGEG